MLRILNGFRNTKTGNMRKPMDFKLGIVKVNFVIIIWYSLFPFKYVEKRGIKDLGSNFWNQGRTQEIAERKLHL